MFEMINSSKDDKENFFALSFQFHNKNIRIFFKKNIAFRNFFFTNFIKYYEVCSIQTNSWFMIHFQ